MFKKIGNLIGKTTGGVLIIVLIILIVISLYALSGLIFWGIGSLIVWTFKISFVWTYWHGVCAAMIVSILTSIFGGRKNE